MVVSDYAVRLAPEETSIQLTGFEHNAVTCIGMKTEIPVKTCFLFLFTLHLISFASRITFDNLMVPESFWLDMTLKIPDLYWLLLCLDNIISGSDSDVIYESYTRIQVLLNHWFCLNFLYFALLLYHAQALFTTHCNRPLF